MNVRKMLFVPALMTAAAAPYLMLDDQWQPMLKDQVMSVTGNTSSRSAQGRTAPTWTETGTGEANPHDAATSVHSLQEVLRFDVSTDWVISRWHRVSTVVSEQELKGLRVPLVTGTSLADVAGSLTYYFDASGRVQRISFHGHTGNPQHIIDMTTRYFHLRPEATLGAGMYVKRWNAVPTSVLRVSHAAVLRADQPHGQLLVDLELNRAEVDYGLSPEFQYLLQHDRYSKRW